MGILKRAWTGQERLYKVWWGLGLPVNLLGDFLAEPFARLAHHPARDAAAIGVLMMLSLGAAWFAWAYATWRCAPNVNKPVWKWVARSIIILVPVWGFVESQHANALEPLLAAPSQKQLGRAWFAPQGGQSPFASPNVSPLNVTAWRDKAGPVLYLDSRWHKWSPPGPTFPDSTEVYYEGKNDIAAFGASSPELSVEAYGAGYAQEISGYEIAAVPNSVTLAGQKVWVVGMESTNPKWPAHALLFVFRDPKGLVWHIFAAKSYAVDVGFLRRAEALATACVHAAFTT